MYEQFIAQLTPILTDIVYRGYDIFIAPWTNFDLIWVLIPIYINWYFSDFLSTKAEFSNAAVSGFTYLWVGVNWLKEYFRSLNLGFTSIRQMTLDQILSVFYAANMIKLAIVGAIFFYGLMTMNLAAHRQEIGKYLGDVRTHSYLMIVLTPLLFGTIPFDIITVNSIIFYGIIFYLVTELIYRSMNPAKENKKD